MVLIQIDLLIGEKDIESFTKYYPYYLADINHDKKVDIYDYNLLKEDYGKSSG